MSKLKSIITGWKNYYKGKNIPEPLKEVFDERLAICNTNECGNLFVGMCTACGCPVNKKTKSLDETCPANMWNPIYYDHDIEGLVIMTSEIPPLLRDIFQQSTYSVDLPYTTVKNWEEFLKWLVYVK